MPIIVKRRVNKSGDGAPSGGQIVVSPGGDVLATWYAPGRLARVLDEGGNLLSAKIAFPTATSTAAWIDPDEFAILSGDNGVSIQRYDRIGETVGGPISVAAGGKADDLALLASGNVVATYRVGNGISRPNPQFNSGPGRRGLPDLRCRHERPRRDHRHPADRRRLRLHRGCRRGR